MPRILTNNLGLPEPIVRALENDKYESRGYISVTGLIDSPKVRLLKKYFDYYEDVSDLVWSLFGSAMHVVLERSVEQIEKYEAMNNIPSRYESEVGMEYDVDLGELGVYKLTGTTDLKMKNPVKITFDYKQTTAWKLLKCTMFPDPITGVMIYKAGAENLDWQKQLNIYNFIQNVKYNSPSDYLRIIVILKDWKRGETMTNSDYPKHSIQQVDIPIYSPESMKKFIEDRMREHVIAEKIFLEHGIDAVPECTMKERWSSEETWKIYKDDTSQRALTGGVFTIKTNEDKVAAANFLEYNLTHNSKAVLKKYTGKDIRCEDFCPMNSNCNYYKSKFTN